jgi:hypothetical protein
MRSTLLLTFVSACALCALSGSEKPSISDKDRADFLLSQRDWMSIQKTYEEAFNKEPAVVSFQAKAAQLQKTCGALQFDMKTVQCVEPPKPEPKVGPTTK